jgi:hypothetical protein
MTFEGRGVALNQCRCRARGAGCEKRGAYARRRPSYPEDHPLVRATNRLAPACICPRRPIAAIRWCATGPSQGHRRCRSRQTRQEIADPVARFLSRRLSAWAASIWGPHIRRQDAALAAGEHGRAGAGRTREQDLELVTLAQGPASLWPNPRAHSEWRSLRHSALGRSDLRRNPVEYPLERLGFGGSQMREEMPLHRLQVLS